jgi:hypothetical protein
MRLALNQGIVPARFALGAAAAMAAAYPATKSNRSAMAALCESLWGDAGAGERKEIIDLIAGAQQRLMTWTQEGLPPLESLFGG